MYLYLAGNDVNFTLAVTKPNETFAGDDILLIQDILGREEIYSSFKATYRESKIALEQDKPVLICDLDSYEAQNSGIKYIDFTQFVKALEDLLADDYATTPELDTAEKKMNAVANLFNQIVNDPKEYQLDLLRLSQLYKAAKSFEKYLTGEESFLITLDEIDRALYQKQVEAVNKSLKLDFKRRIYSDARVNSGKAMQSENDRMFFRVPGPRTIFESSDDFSLLKPDMLSFYTKEHITRVKNYRSALNDKDLKGYPEMVDDPISVNEKELYTALCQIMADSVRMPKTGFVYVSDETEGLDIDENDIIDPLFIEETAKEATTQLPEGKMWCCHDKEKMIDIGDDDNILNHGKLDEEVEDYFYMLIKAIGSWNWAYTGCFPHAVGYSEVSWEEGQTVKFIDNPQSKGYSKEEGDLNSLDIQDIFIRAQYKQGEYDGITLRQRKMMSYIESCYQDFGPKVLAEAIIKLARWGKRRISKLHLGNSNKYFNLQTANLDSRSGSLAGMELVKVDSRNSKLVNVLIVTTNYRDSMVANVEYEIRKCKNFPIGVVAQTTYRDKENPEIEDAGFLFISLLDLIEIYSTGIEDAKIAGIDLTKEGKFVISSKYIAYDDNEKEMELPVLDLSTAIKYVKADPDGVMSIYTAEDLCGVDCSILEAYNTVREEPVIRKTLDSLEGVRFNELASFLRNNNLSPAMYLKSYTAAFMHNVYDDFLVPTLEDIGENKIGMKVLSSLDYDVRVAADSSNTFDYHSRPGWNVLLEEFLNTMLKCCIEKDYHNFTRYSSDKKYCDSHNVKKSNYVISIMNSMVAEASPKEVSKMDLLNQNPNQAPGENAGSLGGQTLFRKPTKSAKQYNLYYTVNPGTSIYIGRLFVDQDELGHYGVLVIGKDMPPSDEIGTQSVTKSALFKLIAIAGIDVGVKTVEQSLAAKMGPKITSRLYFANRQTAAELFMYIK